MGCWEGTCAFSNLPIRAGQKVKVFLLLTSNEIITQTCYSNCIVTPINFPFTAHYDDYGGIENIEYDWNAKFIESVFMKKFQYDLVSLIKELKRDPFEINCGYGLFQNYMTFSLVLDDIYNQITQVECDDYFFKKRIKTYNFDKDFKDFEDSILRTGFPDHYDIDNIVNFIRRAEIMQSSTIITPMINSFCEDINHLKEHIEEFKTHTINFYKYSFILNASRRTWIPPSGKGSQTIVYDLHKNIANIISNQCDESSISLPVIHRNHRANSNSFFR